MKRASALVVVLLAMGLVVASCGGSAPATMPDAHVDAASPTADEVRESPPAPAEASKDDSSTPTGGPHPSPSPQPAVAKTAPLPEPTSEEVEEVAPQASLLYFWAAW